MVTVPNVVGTTNTAAISTLEGLGLVVVENHVNDAAPLNQVIDQNPVATTSVTAGTTITITVSNGPSTGSDISGIWRMNITSIDVPATCSSSGGPGDAKFLLSDPSLKSYVTVTQTGADVSLSFLNGITTTGTLSVTNSITITDKSNSFSDAGGLTSSIGFSFNNVNYVPGTGAVVGKVVNTSTNGASSCSQTLSFTADYVYKPTGTENYDGLYQMEVAGHRDSVPGQWRPNQNHRGSRSSV